MTRPLVALLVLSATVVAAQPQTAAPPRDSVPQNGTAAIRGRVVDDKDAPIRKAIVVATAPAIRMLRSALTDVNGRYEIKNLPAGKYSVSVTRTTYIRASFGQQRPLGPGTPFDLADGQIADRVDFKLLHDGVVTGRIVDEFGDSVADAQVEALHYQSVQGARRLVTARSTTSNDIGEYRLFGLAPGDYYVSASQNRFAFDVETADRAGYATIYYPGTASPDEAQRITTAAGQIASNINMTIVPAHAVRISGTVIDSQGRPFEGARVNIVSRSGGSLGRMTSTPVRADGSFALSGITAGEYTLRATGGSEPETAAMPITIAGDDIVGVSLTTHPPSTLRGRVNGDASAAALKTSSLRVTAAFADGAALGATAIPKDDGTFEMMLSPGRVVLRVPSTTPDWRLRSVRIGGADVTDRGFDVTPGSVLTEVVVELTSKHSEVSGVVTLDTGEKTRDATIVFFAQDSELWGHFSRFEGLGSPGPDGTYKVRLTPGAYYAVALREVDRSQWNTPEFLVQLRDRAVAFRLAEGESKGLDLRLSPP